MIDNRLEVHCGTGFDGGGTKHTLNRADFVYRWVVVGLRADDPDTLSLCSLLIWAERASQLEEGLAKNERLITDQKRKGVHRTAPTDLQPGQGSTSTRSGYSDS